MLFTVNSVILSQGLRKGNNYNLKVFLKTLIRGGLSCITLLSVLPNNVNWYFRF